MANVTIAVTDVWLPEIWSTLILERLDDTTVMLDLTDRRYEKFGSGGGDTIHVPDLTALTARTLASMTGSLTTDASTHSVTDIAINTFIYLAPKIDEAAVLLNPLPIVALYTDEIGRALAEKLDTDIMSGMDGTSNTVGTDNVAVDEATFFTAKETLDKNNNRSEDRFVVVSAETYIDMLQIDRFANSLYAQSSGALDAGKGGAYKGRLMDFGLYMSNNVPAGAAGNKGFMWQKTGFATVVRQDLKVDFKDPHDEFARIVRARMVYGTKLMRANSVVEIDAR